MSNELIVRNGLVVKGTTAITNNLDLTGSARINTDAAIAGQLNVTGSTVIGGKLSTLNDLAVTGSARINTDVNVGGQLNVTGSTVVTGKISTLDDLAVTGSARINTDVNVGGQLNVTGSTVVTGKISTLDDLAVTGSARVNTNVNVGGNLNVTGSTVLGGKTTVSSSLDVTGSIAVIGSGSISGDLNVSSSLIVGSKASVLGDLAVTGSARINTDLNLGGQLNVTGSTVVTGKISTLDDLAVTGSARINTNVNVGGQLNVTGSTVMQDKVSMLGDLSVTGSARINTDVNVGGQLNVTGSAVMQDKVSMLNGLAVTGSIYSDLLAYLTSSHAVSASYAKGGSVDTASYIQNAQSASYVLTTTWDSASLGSILSASVATRLHDIVNDATTSIAGTASFALKAADLVTTNNYTVTQFTASSIQVTNLKVVTITSSIVYASGSNVFGDSLTSNQLFTGSVKITGSLNVDSGTTTKVLTVNTAGLPATFVTAETTGITTATPVDAFADTAGYAAKWFVSARSGTNYRTSEVMAAWDAAGNVLTFTEFSTTDVGDTNPMVFSIEINSNVVSLTATPASGTWGVRTTRILM
jgi:cytoskeletal protein CcmA (bactofilin family)